MATEITMTKAHSPHEVKFKSDTDPHFVIVEILKKATGEVRGQHYILKSDLATWISYYEGDNFEVEQTE